MIDTVELQQIKTKFARLLSRLYTDAKFSIENINESLIKSDFLDCFENNDHETFLKISIEEISEKLGAGKMKFNEELNEELYWAGLQYMNVFLNKMVPLKQLLIQIPISTMIEQFEIYHEMNDIEVLKAYTRFSDLGILKRLRKQSGRSIREVSYITGIPENSLKRYEKNDEYLFRASFEAIYSLSRLFNVNASVFRKQTAFIPYSEHLWNDTNFNFELKKQLCNFVKADETDTLIVRDTDTVKEALEMYRKVVVIEPIGFLYTAYSDRILKKHIDEDLIRRAIYESIRYAINNSTDTNAYF